MHYLSSNVAFTNAVRSIEQSAAKTKQKSQTEHLVFFSGHTEMTEMLLLINKQKLKQKTITMQRKNTSEKLQNRGKLTLTVLVATIDALGLFKTG